MKTEKYYLILATVAAILCVPALGEADLPRGPDVTLLGRANPTLAGIEDFYVFIVRPSPEPNKDGLVFEELRRKVEHKLEEAGVKYVKPRSIPTPELRIYIDMLKLLDSQKYVFRIQTSLARKVILPEQQKVSLKADVWKMGPTMQAVSVESMPAKVTDVVLEQAEAFIHAYLAANPQSGQSSKARTGSVVSLTAQKEPAKPARSAAVAKYKYVASKNSKVFHKPECHWAKRIKPENLVGYSSRDEAIKAGKRPCKICKP